MLRSCSYTLKTHFHLQCIWGDSLGHCFDARLICETYNHFPDPVFDFMLSFILATSMIQFESQFLADSFMGLQHLHKKKEVP